MPSDFAPPSRKRPLLKLGVFLLLGAIVNVAVAWGFAVVGNHIGPSANYSRAMTDGTSFQSFGASSAFVFDLGSGVSGVFHDERGWPMHCLTSQTWIQFDGSARIELTKFGVVTQGSRYVAPARYYPRVLPLRPIWPGFAINAIFYSAMLLPLWFAARMPGKIRRLVRVRRGCCPACGYQIASGVGDKCSECGAELPARLTQRSPSARG